MVRFVTFLVLIGVIVAGILWIVDPQYIGMAPRPAERDRGTRKVEKYTVKDALQLGAKEGSSGSLSGPLGNTLRDAIEIPSAMVRASKDQEVSAQIERNIKEIYVQPGQKVQAGQVIAQLDDSLSQQEVKKAFIDWDTRTRIAIDAAFAESKVTKAIAKRSQELYEKRVISLQEYEIDVFRADRAEKEWLKAKEDHKLAEVTWEKAKRELELHKLVSEVAGQVEKVNKKKGETARVGEPVATIVSADRLWVEGAVDQQYVRFLRPGMRLQVLPERANPPMMELREHTEPITGIAISPDNKVLASSSKDGRVVLWHWSKGVPIWYSRAGRPDVDFESVTFSPAVEPGTEGVTTYRLLAGCSDGTARHWTITVKAIAFDMLEVADSKQAELKQDQGGHSGPVTAVAFSPEGQFCVTGGEDRQICLWKLNGFKLQYALRADNNENETAHRGTITAVTFTPEGMLISAAADRTLKKWKLGENKAQLLQEVSGRSGDIKQISISNDGKLALFDHEEELRILNLADFRTQSVLTSRQLGHFKNLACFSPEADMILTTTTNGRLQLWSTPVRPEIQAVYRNAYAQGISKNNFHILGLLTARLGTSTEFCAQSAAWAMTAAPQDVQIGSQGSANLFLGVPELWNLGGQPFRQLQTPESTTETCGDFTSAPFFFTGGTDKVIRVWAKPTAEEAHAAMEAVITFIGTQVEGGLVRVRAEMDNPTDPQHRLAVGTKVNMRAYPETLQARRPRPQGTVRAESAPATNPTMTGD